MTLLIIDGNKKKGYGSKLRPSGYGDSLLARVGRVGSVVNGTVIGIGVTVATDGFGGTRIITVGFGSMMSQAAASVDATIAERDDGDDSASLVSPEGPRETVKPSFKLARQ